MPFIKRIVEPQYLSNRPLPPGCDRELDTVSNFTLCGLVRQLADLSLRAHDIFSDINAESHVLAHKAASLRRRITRLEEVVEILDARSVKVPESTLEQFKNTTNHYKASHKVDQDLFVQGTRPGCLQAIYDGASTDLKDIYAKFKEYHEDEVTVISMQASSLLAAEYKAQSEYNIIFPRYDITLPSPDQKKENLPNPKRTQRPLSDVDILSDSYLQRLQSPLPTPEEVLRQHVGSSTLVTVDTSGSGFERMANIRRSLTLTFRMSSRSRKERKEKKAWRRTVTGIPREVEDELKLGRRRSNSGSEYTSSSSTDFEELRTQSLDRKMKYSVREFNRAYEAGKVGKDGKPLHPTVAVVAPLRNRRRHRHSVADSSKIQQALNLNGSASLPRGLGLLRPRSVPAGGAMGTVQGSGGSTDSSMEKIWQNAASNRLSEKVDSSQHSSSTDGQGQATPKLFLSQMSHLPDAVITTQAQLMPVPTNPTVASHRKDPHSQHHLQQPQDQAALAASVCLRMQKSTLRKEDRRSSSGNWSGTDSTRTSLCSEQDSQANLSLSMDASPSDSAVSLSNEMESSQGTPTAPCASIAFPGLVNGEGTRPSFLPVHKSSHSSSSDSPTPTNEVENASSFTRLDTETWLKSVGAAAAQNGGAALLPEVGNTAPSIKGANQLKAQLSFGDSSSESSVENAASIVSDNTSLDLDAYFGDSAEEFQDSDSLSAFSVDQEGYWTSMHSDCGLSPKHSKHPSGPEQPQSIGYDFDIAAHYRGKESRRGYITPRNKVTASEQTPALPIREESFSLDSQLSALHLRPAKDGSPVSLDSTPSNQTLTNNDSDGSRSVTPAPSDMSDISSASYDLPPPLGSPTEKMYTLCFPGSGKPLVTSGAKPITHTAQETSTSLSLASSKSSTGSHYTQPLINGTAQVADATTALTSLSQVTGQSQVHSSMVMQNHFPPATTVAASTIGQASDFWATPIPGAMVKARERFYGYKPSTTKPSASSESDADTLTPISSPLPSDASNIFFGLYPGSYSTIKRKSKDNTYTIYTNGMSTSLINKPANVISPTNSLERKQKFNRYVSDLQAQAPQTYDTLSQLKMGEERQTKALTREQRAEILDQMRKSKSNGRSSSMATPPTTPTTPPVHLTATDVSTVLATSAASPTPSSEEARTTSFRSSYKEGVGSQNLDPDQAIIHAANHLEDHKRGTETEDDKDSQKEGPGDPGRPTTPKNIVTGIPEESQQQHAPYVYDPNRRPAGSILKGGKKGDDLMTKGHKSKKKQNVSSDPFADTAIGQMMAADSPYDVVPNSSRTIRFSETVIVENTPVRVCLVSGKPRTNITDFKALLQQQASPSSAKPMSACSALNVKSNVKGSRNAELLYRGSLLEGESSKMGKTDQDQESTDSPILERKIVTVNDLKNALASAKGNVRMVNVGEGKDTPEVVNASSCATVMVIPSMAELPIRETVINGADEITDSHEPAAAAAEGGTDCDAGSSADISDVVEDPSAQDESDKDTADQNISHEVLSTNNSNNNATSEKANLASPQAVSSPPPTETANSQSKQTTFTEASVARQPPKHSWSDTDLNHSHLMAAIRSRGKVADQRETAVARLEEARSEAARQSLSERSLPVSRSEGSIHSLLDSVKHSIQKMSPKHEAHEGAEMDYPPDAWD